jgi:imidazole glycerol-phosphate synthase subunit HisH
MTIAVVDVCSGNLRSVEKALAHAGGDPIVTSDPDVIRRADRIVVPGQGAFGAFARGMAERQLEAPLREALKAGKPFLGICLGMQVLLDRSEEQGPIDGLGLIPGEVVRFRPPAVTGTGDGHPLKVPHMGWNRVRRTALGAADPLLRGVPEDAYVYFVHSYYVAPRDRGVVALECDYGVPFAAALRQDNLFACQFHPEKSQQIGLTILRNFVAS